MNVSFTGLLFLLFLGLKLGGIIAWSWWWVTAPLWAGLAIFLGLMGGGAVLGGLVLAGSCVIRKIRGR